MQMTRYVSVFMQLFLRLFRAHTSSFSVLLFSTLTVPAVSVLSFFPFCHLTLTSSHSSPHTHTLSSHSSQVMQWLVVQRLYSHACTLALFFALFAFLLSHHHSSPFPLPSHSHTTQTLSLRTSGVELLARGCKQLRFVYFNLNDRITDVSMRALANPGRGSLASLDSASSSSSSSSSYAPPLSRYLTPPPSHILEVALGTTHITDDGVEVIARASPNLRGVTFGSPRLTDRSLACLAQCCPRISEVHFHLCDGITDRGLEVSKTRADIE